jgi:hypothetical protein
MTNDLAKSGLADDGFSGGIDPHSMSFNYLKWSAANGWTDRDGVKPPSPLLVFSIDTAMRRWQNQQPTIDYTKPLPDCDELNGKIPISEWERGLDGLPQKPWKPIVIIRFISLATGELYRYEADTTGAHVAFSKLKESVITMRALRGLKVMPLVTLSQGQMKSKKFGRVLRPSFEIVGWKAPGDETKVVPAKPTLQLVAPTPAPAPAPKETPPAQPAAQAPTTPPASAAYQAQPKPAVNLDLAKETLAAMSDVQPVTLNEALDDEVPF